jgi:TatA/E family protein of Tat protein translocase
MGNLGWPEILMILVIALIIFGPRKLPELGKTLGQSLAQFRKASEDFKRTWEEEVEIEKHKLDAPAPKIAETSHTTSEHQDTGQAASAHSDSNYWLDEPATESATTESKAEPETVPTVPAIVRESNAVPRQTKRDWM